MKSIGHLSTLFIIPFLLGISGPEGSCRNSNMTHTPEETTKHIPAGTWGGSHINLEVTDEGASLELDCAHGAITQPLALDSEGHFDVKGTYARESHGPARSGAVPADSPARYTGSVSGDVMKLSITLDDSSRTNDIYTLTHGRQGKLTKCG
jgi:hypothetical protein